MHHAEAEFQVHAANDQFVREHRDTVLSRTAQLAREASPTPSLRRRVGEAVIAFGVRLAGESGRQGHERRLVTRPT
jgi:hypothetical protein